MIHSKEVLPELNRSLLIVIATAMLWLAACSPKLTSATEPTSLIQYKIVACEEKPPFNNICDGLDERLDFSLIAYSKPGVVAPNQPDPVNGEVYFTNLDYPGGYTIDLSQKSNGKCIVSVSDVQTFPGQARTDLIFSNCP